MSSVPRSEAAKRRQSCFLSAAPRDISFLRRDPNVPGPGQYNPSLKSCSQMALICSREDRFKVSKDTHCGPGAYQLSPTIMNTLLKGTFNVTLNNPLSSCNFSRGAHTVPPPTSIVNSSS
ncbi:sperm-tail PG-rich repeat-containing protein 2-like [Thalassophryne amazonica]|uniref:sperm-tail PG-rich repeat-containing protein 2-like n=1 Tax=Thalassophryne amazonica TaxID=390379 RepID=UPI00147158D8|nr:sperm-tail PG-rich repeat-containing protein 2-like [Thalassophryne amazonica]